MKLINHLIWRITLVFTVVMLFWSACYFVLQMKEIHDGNDEGLTNLKQEFIAKANRLPDFAEKMERETPLNLIVKEISKEEAQRVVENFKTTKVYFPTELEREEVRMLSSAFFCTQNGKYYQIQLFTSTVESDDLIENMLYLLLGLWTALILTLIIVSKIIISRANKPFYRLLSELKKFRLDNNTMVCFPETKIEEYRQLNEAVEELLTKNMEVFTEQKQFIENSSHELQTPLAVVIAKLEMLLEKCQHREEAAEIAALLNTLNRMKRMNSNLLLLSKIKNSQLPNASVVNLREVVENVLADFEDFAAYKQVTVERRGDFSPSMRMNRDLAHILFSNLIKNAIAHNEAGGKVVVSCEANAITVSNSGNQAVANVFSRYRRGGNDKDSCGLGLSIVKSIADLHKLEVAYRFEEAMHHFKIALS
ncbi:MAG: HAMP domain-containing histidine kinase [Prevotellaceae bacterium]|jgi:signal transduction histidine kinase|nr:HAMP domain-containing histidine kinase [Prevotellaceae bacterium]